MAEEKTNIIYKAADIQRYLAGKMSPAEMHALEKAALDDPFLAEAIEGYEAIAGTELETSISFLKDKFSVHNNAKLVALKPGRRITLWKAAAAILVICSGISITYILTNKQQAADKSIASLPLRTDTSHVRINELKTGDTNIIGNQNNVVISPEMKPEKNIASAEVEPLKDTAFMYRPAPAQSKIAKDDAGGGYVADTPKQERDLAALNAAPVPEQNSRTVNEQTNNLSLERKASAKSNKRRPELLQDTLMDVEPEDGWYNYDTYIRNNLSFSNEIPREIQGNVEVSFDVQDNGAITNLKVDKSLCTGCDKEVLRMIKEGPKWKVKKGRKATARITVKF